MLVRLRLRILDFEAAWLYAVRVPLNSARTTPFGLLLSGIALIIFGSFMGMANAYFQLKAFPSIWAWMIVALGMGMVIAPFVWVANLSDETKRRLMVMPRSTRRMYWPFLKKLQFFSDDELLNEVERLKNVKSSSIFLPPATPDGEKKKPEKKEEVFIPPLQD